MTLLTARWSQRKHYHFLVGHNTGSVALFRTQCLWGFKNGFSSFTMLMETLKTTPVLLIHHGSFNHVIPEYVMIADMIIIKGNVLNKKSSPGSQRLGLQS